MSLSYEQVRHLTQEIKSVLEHAVCTEISSPSHHVYIFSFRKGERSHYLLLSFRHGLVRLHLVENASITSNKDSFVRAIQSKVLGATLDQVSLLNEDRIVAFEFSNQGKEYRLIAELVPRRPNCLLIDSKEAVIHSLYPTGSLRYCCPEKPQRSPEKEDVKLMSSLETERHYAAIEADNESAARRVEIEKQLQQRVRKAEKRVQERLQLLEECRAFAKVHHDAELLQANLYRIKKGMTEIEVTDWEDGDAPKKFVLDPKTEPKNLSAQLFRRAKRLHAGISHAEEQLRAAEADLSIARKTLSEAVLLADIHSLEKFAIGIGLYPKGDAPSVRKKAPEPAKPYHRFVSITGMDIWVGKSAKDNDLLTFRHARGLDWWLHASDCPGSHVVLRCQRDIDPDHASIVDAAELALRFSKFKDQGKGDVSITQVKGVTKVKGCPGKVMLSKHKTLSIDLDDERWNRLRRTRS